MSTVLVDIDGVLADLHAEWLRRYNADYGDDLTVERIHQWSMTKAVKPECGGRIYEYLNAADLYDNIPPMPGALDGVGALRDMGHTIAYVTNSVGPAMTAGKLEWVTRHGLLEHGVFVSLTAKARTKPDKSLIRGDLLIDDYDGNCADFGAARSILLTAPYNREASGFPNRARNWTDIVDIVGSLLLPAEAA